mmetsp:Transcript_1728/g.4881  ORF Transcript_1728/g.4881 Transcript_1728/m.4881 type:complete len:206 (+) Transcript_1728:523-1140(+)
MSGLMSRRSNTRCAAPAACARSVNMSWMASTPWRKISQYMMNASRPPTESASSCLWMIAMPPKKSTNNSTENSKMPSAFSTTMSPNASFHIFRKRRERMRSYLPASWRSVEKARMCRMLAIDSVTTALASSSQALIWFSKPEPQFVEIRVKYIMGPMQAALKTVKRGDDSKQQINAPAIRTMLCSTLLIKTGVGRLMSSTSPSTR